MRRMIDVGYGQQPGAAQSSQRLDVGDGTSLSVVKADRHAFPQSLDRHFVATCAAVARAMHPPMC
jgi:hypothetical protein